MHIVVLAGGNGKRLWPISNATKPKQYIEFLNSEENSNKKCSMIQYIWKQLEDANLAKNSIICTAENQVEILQKQIEGATIVAEPCARGTFSAVALSSAFLKSKRNVSEDETICVIPADTFTQASYFEILKTLPDVLEHSNADVVIMGIKPNCPSSKYGYIVPKEQKDEYIKVDYFIEKPDEKTAKRLITQNALWNCGVFCMKMNTIFKYCQKYDIFSDYDEMFKEYSKFPKISFDCEVLENRKDNLSAVVFNGNWSDLGTWDSIVSNDLMKPQENVIMDKSCYNTHVINELDIPVITMGAKNMIVVTTKEGILIADKSEYENIKDVMDHLEKLQAK